MIVILRELVEHELSLYIHKKFEFDRTGRQGSWYSDVAFKNNGTIMSFHQYIKMSWRDSFQTRPLRPPAST